MLTAAAAPGQTPRPTRCVFLFFHARLDEGVGTACPAPPTPDVHSCVQLLMPPIAHPPFKTQLTKHTMVLEMRKDAPRGLPGAPGGPLPVPAAAPSTSTFTTDSTPTTTTTTTTSASASAPLSAAAALAAAIMDLDLDGLPLPPTGADPAGVPAVPTLTLEEGSALGALIDAVPIPADGPGDGDGDGPGIEALVADLFRALRAEGSPQIPR